MDRALWGHTRTASREWRRALFHHRRQALLCGRMDASSRGRASWNNLGISWYACLTFFVLKKIRMVYFNTLSIFFMLFLSWRRLFRSSCSQQEVERHLWRSSSSNRSEIGKTGQMRRSYGDVELRFEEDHEKEEQSGHVWFLRWVPGRRALCLYIVIKCNIFTEW